jgi:hypothetical protein
LVSYFSVFFCCNSLRADDDLNRRARIERFAAPGQLFKDCGHASARVCRGNVMGRLGRGISNLVKAATYFAIIKAVSDHIFQNALIMANARRTGFPYFVKQVATAKINHVPFGFSRLENRQSPIRC